jgi:hypothetical protein
MIKNENLPVKGSDIKLDYEKGENPNHITSIIEEIEEAKNKPKSAAEKNPKTMQQFNMNDLPYIRGDVIYM